MSKVFNVQRQIILSDLEKEQEALLPILNEAVRDDPRFSVQYNTAQDQAIKIGKNYGALSVNGYGRVDVVLTKDRLSFKSGKTVIMLIRDMDNGGFNGYSKSLGRIENQLSLIKAIKHIDLQNISFAPETDYNTLNINEFAAGEIPQGIAKAFQERVLPSLLERKLIDEQTQCPNQNLKSGFMMEDGLKVDMEYNTDGLLVFNVLASSKLRRSIKMSVSDSNPNLQSNTTVKRVQNVLEDFKNVLEDPDQNIRFTPKRSATKNPEADGLVAYSSLPEDIVSRAPPKRKSKAHNRSDLAELDLENLTL